MQSMTPASLVRPKHVYFTLEGSSMEINALIMQHLPALGSRLKIESIHILRMPDGMASCRLSSKHQVTFSTTRRGSTSWKNVLDPLFGLDLTEEGVLHQKRAHFLLESHAPLVLSLGTKPDAVPPPLVLLSPPAPAPPAPTLLIAAAAPVMDSVDGRPAAMIQTEMDPAFLARQLSPGRAVLHAKNQRQVDAAGQPTLDDLYLLAPSKALSAYLTSTDLCQSPKAFRAPDVGEPPIAYNRARRDELAKLKSDRLPWVIRTALLPPVLKKRELIDAPCLSALPADELEALKGLLRWHHGEKGWNGFWALTPRPPTLECCRYGVPEKPDPCASALEVHRRIMALERACHYLAVYIHEAAAKSRVLPKLARNHLKLAVDILGAGCGIWGRDFWTPPPSGSAVVSKLTAALGPNVPPKRLESPAAFRDLSHAYPVLSELDWGLPLLALVHARPLRQGNAKEVLGSLKADEDERKAVYMEALKPRLLYGGLLTRYVGEVFEVAKAFETLNEGVPFPSNCRLALVNDKGYMLGLSNTPASAGHTQFLPGRAPPLPFPPSCLEVRPLPPDELAGLIAARRLKEEGMVDALLRELGIAHSPAAEARKRAIRVVDEALKTDSHKDNRTDFLQATASMMEGVHTPAMMYGM